MELPKIIQRFRDEIDKGVRDYKVPSGFLWGVFVAPIIVLCLAVAFLACSSTRPWARWMLSEAHPVEWLQFFILIMTMVLVIRLLIHARHANRTVVIQGALFFMVLGIFFVAMEEISWGQWVFGFETPEAIRSVNRQREMNIHNLPGIHALFEIFRVLYGIVGLWAMRFTASLRFRSLAPHFVLSSWFVVIVVIAALDLPNYYRPGMNILFIAVSRLVEVLELLIYASLFLYLWFYERKFKFQEIPHTNFRN
jgi:hypothetical protein